MGENEMILAVATLAISIVAWFFKGLINEIKGKVNNLELKVASNTTQIELLKSDHGNLGKKMDDMASDLKEIFIYLRNMDKK